MVVDHQIIVGDRGDKIILKIYMEELLMVLDHQIILVAVGNNLLYEINGDKLVHL